MTASEIRSHIDLCIDAGPGGLYGRPFDSKAGPHRNVESARRCAFSSSAGPETRSAVATKSEDDSRLAVMSLLRCVFGPSGESLYRSGSVSVRAIERRAHVERKSDAGLRRLRQS